MAKPLVSVLMPVRNCGALLEPAIASILDQRYRHLELIVVDDGTTDGSLDHLPFDDERLRIEANRGRGIVDALNLAAELARGEFYARMDGDDIADAARFDKQIEFLMRNPTVGIAGGQVRISGHQQTVGGGYRHYASWINGLLTPEAIRREIFVESPIPHPTAVIKRDVFARLGGYRDSEWAEDYDLWLRAFASGVSMGKPTGIVLTWRDHGDRLSRTSQRYSARSFIKAKAHFLARTVLRGECAVIWGAGPTGRQLHDFLVEEGASIHGFIDVHPRRVGGRVRGLPVVGVNQITSLETHVILSAVGSRGARDRIRACLNNVGRDEGGDYFCVA